MLATSKKLLNLIKEWGIYGVFGVRSSMFGDDCIKIN
jgi:hypothetical protein